MNLKRASAQFSRRFLTLTLCGFFICIISTSTWAALARPWPLQTRFPNQVVYYFFDSTPVLDNSVPWYDVLTQFGRPWTYADPASMWGKLSIKDAFREGMTLLSDAAPGVRLIEIDSSQSADYPGAIAIEHRPEKYITCMASSRDEDGLKRRTIRINKFCHSGIAAHEMLHVLGFRHIQQSPVRETFACVFVGQTYLSSDGEEFTFPDNLTRGHSNFTLAKNGRLLGDYDFDSTMHYSDSLMKKPIKGADDLAVYPKVTLAKRIHPGPLLKLEDCLPDSGIYYWEEPDGDGRSFKVQRNALTSIDRWALRELYFHTTGPDTGADLNGDGMADLVVGVAGGSALGQGSGTGILFGGKYASANSGLKTSNRLARQTEVDSANVPGLPSGLPTSNMTVATADFDGDYVLDIAVGYPDAENGAGIVLISYSQPDMEHAATASDLTTKLDKTAVGAMTVLKGSQAEPIGRSLVTGDFNGDGISDLAMGIPGDPDTSVQKAGIQICFGSFAGIKPDACKSSGYSDLVKVPELKIRGGGFASEMASGDFNGDGYSDLVVSAPGASSSSVAPSSGLVFYFSGDSDGLRPTQTALTQGDGALPDRPEANDRWGTALAAGDFDNDGITDLAIGNPSEDVDVHRHSPINSGYVTVIYGDRKHGISAKHSRNVGLGIENFGVLASGEESFGAALLASDLNGDGYSDLVIGSPNLSSHSGVKSSGAAHMINGGGAGLDMYSTQTIWPQAVCSNCDSPDLKFGSSFSKGDFDGNGFVDLIVGMPGYMHDRGGLIVRYNGSPYSSKKTAIGSSFPDYQILTTDDLTGDGNEVQKGTSNIVLP